jgi:hypothetical protein
MFIYVYIHINIYIYIYIYIYTYINIYINIHININISIGHAESYNPPAEYLLSPEEQIKMDDLDPKDKAYNFIPKQHNCLRHVPGVYIYIYTYTYS